MVEGQCSNEFVALCEGNRCCSFGVGRAGTLRDMMSAADKPMKSELNPMIAAPSKACLMGESLT